MKKIILVTLFLLVTLISGCTAASPTLAPTGTAAVPVTGNEAKVTIANFAYDPVTITIKVGQTVQWTNNDGTAHTVTADDNSWQSSNIGKGETYAHTFTQAGTFTYHCSIHPEMKASVVVSP